MYKIKPLKSNAIALGKLISNDGLELETLKDFFNKQDLTESAIFEKLKESTEIEIVKIVNTNGTVQPKQAEQKELINLNDEAHKQNPRGRKK